MTAGKRIGKRPYEKPRLRAIELTAEEIMGKCKYTNGGGPSIPACSGCAQSKTS